MGRRRLHENERQIFTSDSAGLQANKNMNMPTAYSYLKQHIKQQIPAWWALSSSSTHTTCISVSDVLFGLGNKIKTKKTQKQTLLAVTRHAACIHSGTQLQGFSEVVRAGKGLSLHTSTCFQLLSLCLHSALWA